MNEHRFSNVKKIKPEPLYLNVMNSSFFRWRRKRRSLYIKRINPKLSTLSRDEIENLQVNWKERNNCIQLFAWNRHGQVRIHWVKRVKRVKRIYSHKILCISLNFNDPLVHEVGRGEHIPILQFYSLIWGREVSGRWTQNYLR